MSARCSALTSAFALILGFSLGMPPRGLTAPASDSSEARRVLTKLKAGVVARDADIVEREAVHLARLGGEKSMKALLSLIGRIPGSEDGIYWSLITGTASFVDEPALKALGKAIRASSRKALARDLLYGLAENPSPECLAALRPVLYDAPADVRYLATAKLSRMHVPAAVDELVKVLKKEEKAKGTKPTRLAWLAAEGLAAMTGKEFGPVSVNWQGWWKKNRDKPLRAPGDEDDGSGTGTAVDSLRDPSRRKGFYGVEKAPKEAVVVLSALYTKKTQRDLNNDHMEHVLESMGIPHVVVRREDFRGYDLSKAGAVLINCAQFHKFCICPTCKPGGDKNNRLYKCTGCDKHIIFSAELKDPEIKKLVKFVQSGGYLFCEDWVVKEAVEKGFSKYVAAGVKLKDSAVDVVPARGMGSHPYLRGIFTPKPVGPRVPSPLEVVEDSWEDEEEDTEGSEEEESEEDEGWELGAPEHSGEHSSGRTVVIGADGLEVGAVKVKHTWTIDDESFALKVLNSGRVVSLLFSGKLQKKAKGDGVVALAFRPGSGAAGALPPGQVGPRGVPGVVAVVLSHFGKQGSTEDEYTIQNLLLNFLIDADGARRLRGGAKEE